MRRTSLTTTVLCLLGCVLLVGASPRPAEADVTQAVLALAAPLAQQFGVPEKAITSLLEGGVSVESVTQLLLISQGSKTGFDDVTKLYRGSENDVTRTAEELEVASSTYSMANVNSAIDQAKQKLAADATREATDATQNAADEAGKALDGALGGFGR